MRVVLHATLWSAQGNLGQAFKDSTREGNTFGDGKR